MSATSNAAENKPTLIRGLSLLDSVLLLASGIIGSSIFLTAKDIAGPLPNPRDVLAGLGPGGGDFSFCLCCLRRTGLDVPGFGRAIRVLARSLRRSGGIFIWLDVVWSKQRRNYRCIVCGAAAYAGQILPGISQDHIIFTIVGMPFTRAHLFALLLIAILTYVNVVGLRWGTLLQNVSTWTKFSAMAVFVLFSLVFGKGDWSHFHPTNSLTMGMNPAQLISALGVAMIAVFWAYDGWVYITWVAGEVKEPRRNVPLGMLLGVLAVAAIYLCMNMAYLYALPINEIAQHETIAHAAATALFSPAAALWLSAIIALSCFSAAASCILAGGRVYMAMAQDGIFFKRMADIHPKWRTPAFSLIGQAVWAALLTLSGRYDQLYTYVMFMMVLSYTLTVVGMFILRWKRPEMERPYSLHGIPMVARFVCANRWSMDDQHDHYTAERIADWDGNCDDRSAILFGVEEKEPSSGGELDV